ncbi:MAG TPA: DNA-processing protein DprA [Gemmatimonadaceae bacterium]
MTTYHDLVARFGSAPEAFDATGDVADRAAALESADRAFARANRLGATLILAGDDDYPPKLLDLDHAGAPNQRLSPPLLWALGRTSLLRSTIVAIVGTRRATLYGERATADIASALARAGATIVSGMARGIDAAAHLAALSTPGGSTIAVLGTGVDVAYPSAHRALHERIASEGLLLSEELPGDRANGGSFPKRNRIIAALARLTIVCEAPERSGALITADYARDLSRDYAAVPGRIDSLQSLGSNRLLRDGAQVIADVDDALGLIHAAPSRRIEPSFDMPDERAVWDALAQGPADIDTLTDRARLAARACLAAVTALELRGLVQCALDGEIRRR